MTKKTTNKKATKPAFYVDLTNVETPLDIYCEFANGKVRAGLPITETELCLCEKKAALNTVDMMIDIANEEFEKNTTVIKDDKAFKEFEKLLNKYSKPKKAAWYKRFWNWVTRKNK